MEIILEDLFNHKSVFLKINIGTGKGTTVLELVKTFEKVNNLKVPYVFSQRRPGDVCHVVADNSYLESQFEIFPKRNIEEMCLDGWKFRKLNPKGF